MTVRYDDTLRELLFRWKASVWRIVYKDLLIFSICYASLSCTYRFALNADQREKFENLALYVDEISKNFITILSMLLGFYVSHMVSRWWSQFELIPWPEELMGYVALVVPGKDEQSILVRRTVARYFCLTMALAGRLLSAPMLQRFPTIDTLVKAGIITKEELEIYNKTPPDLQWFLPMQWVQSIMEEQYVRMNTPAPIVSKLQDEINLCIVRFRKLFCYDWINMPLVYTQVVAISTYSYFFACIIGRQFLQPSRDRAHFNNAYSNVDLYVPVFTILQLIFYVGWFRVGQNLMKPFGFDDEDFEMCNILDRHIAVSFALAETPTNPKPPIRNLVLVPMSSRKVDCELKPPLQTPKKTPPTPKKNPEQTKLMDDIEP